MLSPRRPHVAACVLVGVGLFALAPLACGAESYSSSPPSSSPTLPEVPRATEQALNECAKRHADGFTSGDTLVVIFDVEAARDGDVRQTKIRDSMMRGTAMESCMQQAIRAMHVPPYVIAKSTNGPVSGHASPEQRQEMGIVHVVAPIIVELVPIVIKAVEITVVVVVAAIVADDIIVNARKRPKEVEDRCYPPFYECLGDPKANHNPAFGSRKPCQDCFYECIKDTGVWPNYKCPRPN